MMFLFLLCNFLMLYYCLGGNRQLVLARRGRSEDNEKQPDRFGEQSHTPRVSQESEKGCGA